MRVGLAGEEEVEAVEQDAATEGLMGVEIVAQEGDRALEIAGGVLLQPAFGGGDFAVLLGVAVLRGDELGPQGDDLRASRGDDDRGDGAVVVGDLAVGVLEGGTTRAVDLLRRSGTRCRPAR